MVLYYYCIEKNNVHVQKKNQNQLNIFSAMNLKKTKTSDQAEKQMIQVWRKYTHRIYPWKGNIPHRQC